MTTLSKKDIATLWMMRELSRDMPRKADEEVNRMLDEARAKLAVDYVDAIFADIAKRQI